MDQRFKQVGAGLALVTMLGLGTATATATGTFAQESTPSAGATATPRTTQDDGSTAKPDRGWGDQERDRDMDGGHGRGGMRGPGDGFGRGIIVDQDALATFLGITADQLHTELMDGATLVQVAENHGKSRAELEDFLVEQYRARLTEILDTRIAAPDTDDDATTPATGTDNATPEAVTTSYLL